MKKHQSSILETLIPYLIFGVSIAVVLAVFVMLSYVLFWGLVIGGILWALAVLKFYLFPAKSQKPGKGRVIEHQDE